MNYQDTIQNVRRHYLLKVMEECSEISVRASKCIQFGMYEIQAGQDLNNEERLLQEVIDLFAVLEVALDKEITLMIDRGLMKAKIEKVERYREYAKSLKS